MSVSSFHETVHFQVSCSRASARGGPATIRARPCLKHRHNRGQTSPFSRHFHFFGLGLDQLARGATGTASAEGCIAMAPRHRSVSGMFSICHVC